MANGASKSETRTIGIHPRVLQPATFPPFDLYTRGSDGERLHLFRPADEPVYVNTWRKLEQLGVEMLYVDESDRERCLDYVEEQLPALVEQDALPAGHLEQWIYTLAARALEELLENPESPEPFRRVRALMGPLVRLVRTDERAVGRMLDTAPLVYHTPNHCLNVSVLLTGFAARAARVEDDDLLAEVATGGALHDLGKAVLPEQVLQKRSELTRGEFARIRRHPRDGLDLSRPFLRRDRVAQRVILEHHENAGGNGYPEGRTAEAIHTFARMARVVDVYDALTSRRPYGPARSQLAALNIMTSEMEGAFDESLLRRFIRYAASAFQQDLSIRVITGETTVEGEAQLPVESEPASPIMPPGPPVPDSDDGETTHILAPGPEAEVKKAEADAERALDALSELAAPEDEDFALMKGVLDVLRETVAAHVGEQGGAGAGESPQERQETLMHADVERVRPLFSIVWQIDQWRREFNEPTAEPAEAARLRQEVLSCLGDLRNDVALTLRRHHVEIIESADPLHPRLHEVSQQGQGDSEVPPGVHLRRVGFVYRRGDRVEVLEPAQVVVGANLRRAG